MSSEARIAQAARDLASELDGIGLSTFDNIAKAFRHFADFADGRELTPSGIGDRRKRARDAVSDIVGTFIESQNWTFLKTPMWPELIDEIIDAVDLA